MKQETLEWDQRVWELVQQIPPGKVATYGQLAAMLGFPRRSRHVGRALKRSPEGLDLPWYRVLNSSGSISLPLYSEGYHMQRVLLESEGVTFKPNGRLSLKIFQWRP